MTLEQHGLAVYNKAVKQGQHKEEALIKAIASMLEFEPVEGNINITPEQVREILLKCPQLSINSYSTKTDNKLAATMSRIVPPIERTDIIKLKAWIQSGALQWWEDNGIFITWNSVVKHFDSWIAKSRSWNKPRKQASRIR